MGDGVSIRIADCLDDLKTLEADSVDACVTDPPYGINFMGHNWDKPALDVRSEDAERRPQDGNRFIGHIPTATPSDMREFQAWCQRWSIEVLRVLKPGGYLVAFSATRTYHRMASGIEDAGFTPRDMLTWNYGQGFPKSSNAEGGLGTALKPAFEPIMLAQKPREGTYADNHEKYSTGYLNIDASRVPLHGEQPYKATTDNPTSRNVYNLKDMTQGVTTEGNPKGRWPANVVHDGSDDVREAMGKATGAFYPLTVPDHPRDGNGGMLDGFTRIGLNSNYTFGEIDAVRYFYCAKPSRGEKNAGLDGRCDHPTVKPIELMRWLIRLAVPPLGVVLDPFLGSGTTAIAAVLENRPWVGMERESEYAAIAQTRIDWWTAQHKSRPGRSVAEILGDLPKDDVLEGQTDMMDLLA